MSRFLSNKSHLINESHYVKQYIECIDRTFDVNKKQTFFLISKYYTDASGECINGNYHLARHFYDLGDVYSDRIANADPLLYRLTKNVRDRSYSLYFYKLKQYEKAIGLIKETLANNVYLEKKGFEFLLIDRVQHYYNIARVRISKGENEEGLKILIDLIIFLLTQKARLLTDLNQHFLEFEVEKFNNLRTQVLDQIFFDTLEHCIEEVLNDSKKKNLKVFTESIIKHSKEIGRLSIRDIILKDLLIIVRCHTELDHQKLSHKLETFKVTNRNYENYPKALELLEKLKD